MMIVHICRKVIYGLDVSYRICIYVLGVLMISVSVHVVHENVVDGSSMIRFPLVITTGRQLLKMHSVGEWNLNIVKTQTQPTGQFNRV